MKKLLFILLALFFTTDAFSRIRLKKVDVVKGEVEIKNVAGFAFDYNNFQMLINNSVHNLSNMTIVSGNLNAGVDEVIVISGFTFPSAASVSIWYPGTFSTGSANVNLVDFMQYGSAGNPYEASADSAGLWTIGDFVSGNPPYIHTGGPTDEGASYWQANTVGADELTAGTSLTLYPNPAKNVLNLDLETSMLGESKVFVLIDLHGKMLLEVPVQSLHMSVPISDLPEGIYIAAISNKKGIVERKRFLVNR